MLRASVKNFQLVTISDINLSLSLRLLAAPVNQHPYFRRMRYSFHYALDSIKSRAVKIRQPIRDGQCWSGSTNHFRGRIQRVARMSIALCTAGAAGHAVLVFHRHTVIHSDPDPHQVVGGLLNIRFPFLLTPAFTFAASFALCTRLHLSVRLERCRLNLRERRRLFIHSAKSAQKSSVCVATFSIASHSSSQRWFST